MEENAGSGRNDRTAEGPDAIGLTIADLLSFVTRQFIVSKTSLRSRPAQPVFMFPNDAPPPTGRLSNYSRLPYATNPFVSPIHLYFGTIPLFSPLLASPLTSQATQQAQFPSIAPRALFRHHVTCLLSSFGRNFAIRITKKTNNCHRQAGRWGLAVLYQRLQLGGAGGAWADFSPLST